MTAQARRASPPTRDAVGDAAVVLIGLLVGFGLAQFFRWDIPEVPPTVTAPDIALHNVGLALLGVAGTRYLATPIMAISAFWLGLGVAASAALRGWPRTAALTLPHAPIEVVAWLLTLAVARLAWPTLTASRADPGRPAALRSLARLTPITLGVYLLAAAAEGAEIALVWHP